MDLIVKSDNWHLILCAFDTYKPKHFDIKHLSSIRTTLSTTIKEDFPNRVYKTKTTEEHIIVERLK